MKMRNQRGLFLMLVAVSAAAKEGPTFYTADRVAVARDNLARYDWAKAVLERIMVGDSGDYYVGREYASARDIAALSDDAVWVLMPTTAIPRVQPADTKALCPLHGEEVRKVHAWTAWRVDPIHHPYKVQCRLGGEWYPSNNFLAGDMTSGDFPDDGDGCLYQGKRYYFLREYAHLTYGNTVIPALRSLSQAWLLTGEPVYAHKGCILLARLATEYPNFDDRQDRLFYARYGGTDPHYPWKHGGMITDFIWETFCLEATVLAYDALFDFMAQDPALLSFLKAKGMPVDSPADLRRYIEEKVIRVGMQGLLNGHIRGNEGFHQAAAMACALVLDDYSDTHPNSQDMVEFAFLGEGHSAYMLANGLTRDGGGHESPGYNTIKLDFIRVARLMELIRARHPDLFPVDRYPDIFANPKAKALFDHFIDLLILNCWLPSIGDTGSIEPPVRQGPWQWSYLTTPNLYAFSRYRDPRHARPCASLDGKLFTGEVFEPYPEAELREALARPESLIERRPRLLDGYGVALLEVPDGDSGHAVALNYSSLLGHRQGDHLNLELFSQGLECLDDLGYPFTWDYREWDSSIMSHNTVSVDETEAAYAIGGAASLMASTEGVHIVAAHHDPYPVDSPHPGGAARDVDLYERTVVMVDVAPGRFYVVDLFAVSGGSLHRQSWHGPLCPIELPPLPWQAREGTLAGPEVPQFAEYQDRWGRRGCKFPCFLTRIREASIEEPALFSWDFGLPEGDRLNLHIIPTAQAALWAHVGTGRSPARPEDWGLDYLLLDRQAEPRQPTHFLTVLEAFQGAPTVQAVRLPSSNPLVLEVIRDGAVDEITLATPPGPSRTTAHRPLGLRLRTRQGKGWTCSIEVGEWGEGQGPGYGQAVIRQVSYEDNRLAVDASHPAEEDFAVGRYLRIFNWGRTAMFRILAVEPKQDLLWLTLDTTAFLGQGPAVAFRDSSVWLDAYLTFANNRVDERDQLVLEADYFAGSWLGEGPAARQIQGAVRDSRSRLILRDRVPAADLERDYGGKVVTLYQYGVGDSVEVARIRVR